MNTQRNVSALLIFFEHNNDNFDINANSQSCARIYAHGQVESVNKQHKLQKSAFTFGRVINRQPAYRAGCSYSSQKRKGFETNNEIENKNQIKVD